MSENKRNRQGRQERQAKIPRKVVVLRFSLALLAFLAVKIRLCNSPGSSPAIDDTALRARYAVLFTTHIAPNQP